MRRHLSLPRSLSLIGVILMVTVRMVSVRAADSGVTHRIYRANSTVPSTWTWIGDTSSGSTTWLHTSPGATSNAYWIKAKAVQSTGAGSYTNLSLGKISNVVSPPY